MRTNKYSAKELVKLFRAQKIATMADLKEALGTSADATVFRKLNELPHRSSYSHRGRFYTLDSIARYDDWGLWSVRSVWFSRRGTLVETAAQLVEESEAGFFVAELDAILRVEVKAALLKLFQQDRVAREKVEGRFLYCAYQRNKRKEQLRARRVLLAKSEPGVAMLGVEVIPDELKAAVVLFYSMLNEKERRLYAGLESMKIGHGGDRRMADLLGLTPVTVARGRQELFSRDVDLERTRKKGAGRPAIEKKRLKSSKKSKL